MNTQGTRNLVVRPAEAMKQLRGLLTSRGNLVNRSAFVVLRFCVFCLFTQPVSNDVGSNAKRAGNSRIGPSEVMESMYSALTIYARLVLLAHALAWRVVMLMFGHNDKVVRVIVQPIAVNVVNDLTRQQRTSDLLSGNNAMLQQICSPLATDNPVAVAVDMSALPIRMIGAVPITRTLDFATTHRALAELLQSVHAQCLMAQCSVFCCRQTMSRAQMRGCYLHRADKATQRTGNRIRVGRFLRRLDDKLSMLPFWVARPDGGAFVTRVMAHCLVLSNAYLMGFLKVTSADASYVGFAAQGTG